MFTHQNIIFCGLPFGCYLRYRTNTAGFEFAATTTKQMILLFTKEKSIEKMFIEPHPQTRLGLESETKISLHGCQAVRHDDHLHIQIFH